MEFSNDEASSPYRWRRLTDDQREAVLEYRNQQNLPWHSVPHYESGHGYYLITAACYEHHANIGTSSVRMTEFEADLRQALSGCLSVFVWTVLPNHYHVVVEAESIKPVLKELGQLHGRTAHRWNGEDERRGRKVWCNAAETVMKSDRHFYATVNYVLNNAVRHGYVARWQDWPYCNAAEYLDVLGRDEAKRRWLEYPVLDYGDSWDPPEL